MRKSEIERFTEASRNLLRSISTISHIDLQNPKTIFKVSLHKFSTSQHGKVPLFA